MDKPELVIDACALINLLSTGDEDRLIGALNVRLVTSVLAQREIRYRKGPPDDDGGPTQIPLDTSRFVKAGLLVVRELDLPLQDAFVAAVAAGLRDADASVVALAGTAKVPLATDDNRVRRLAPKLYPPIVLRSTLGLVREATDRLRLPEQELRDLLRQLRESGNFLPPKTDENAAWYAAALVAHGTEVG